MTMTSEPLTDLLIDPDCLDGECGSCTGGACEHDCHAKVLTWQMVYSHPTLGVLAVASIGGSLPPAWRVEPVGQCIGVVEPEVGFETQDGAANVLTRMGETLARYLRAHNAAQREARAAMRVTAAPDPS